MILFLYKTQFPKAGQRCNHLADARSHLSDRLKMFRKNPFAQATVLGGVPAAESAILKK